MSSQATILVEESASNTNIDDLQNLFRRQKAAHASCPFPEKATRLQHLDTLISALKSNEQALIAAMNDDFGNRSEIESLFTDVTNAISATRHAKQCLRRWMKPTRVATPAHLLPAKAMIKPQPLGCVGIISPWNFPVILAIEPIAAALAAGNRVILKPSEITPKTSTALQQMLSDAFDDKVVGVVTGGADVGTVFSSIPFDHLFFTGSTAIGRKVAVAAAQNLTPVTLELGGKSPVIIDETADIKSAARSIAFGKMLNAGQACISPDYVLAPAPRVQELGEAIAAAARALFPSIDQTNDYTSIVSDEHFDRLTNLVAQARDAKVPIIEVGEPAALGKLRKLPLTLVLDPPKTLGIMQEEIFGPILPIIGVQSLDEAIKYIDAGERPLALYWFGDDQSKRDRVLDQTISGGVAINDTMIHFAHPGLPFGGIGASGIGRYHGYAGFETFSHMKPILMQSRFAQTSLLQPPYTDRTKTIIRLLQRFI
ncbi:MAG: coniferyl aldehyde dehydrogenase [Pseudomonadota bacterium]